MKYARDPRDRNQVNNRGSNGDYYRGNYRDNYYSDNRTNYRGSARERRERMMLQRKRRRRNRLIIVVSFLLTAALIVGAIVLCLNNCSSDGSKSSSDEKGMTVPFTSGTSSQNNSATKPTDEFPTENSGNEFNAPKVEDDGSDGRYEGSLYVWKNSAFEMFYGDEDLAKGYSELMNKAADSLGDDINLYSMIVPNHSEFGLPERLKGEGGATTYSQADYIKAAYEAMNSNVNPVNVYNALSEHCNEYIYFRSDHHWTGLGAYYAYASFMEQIGKTPLNLDDCEENVIEGFTGSFLKLVSSGVKEDDVYYWKFPYSAPMTVTDKNGTTSNFDSPYYPYSSAGDYTYSVFIVGDNPMAVIKSSSDNADDEKILVIHESYGNALIPYLSNNYSEVYSVDFRDWDGNIKDFCEENGITNVLFLNGVMSSATTVQIDAMESLI